MKTDKKSAHKTGGEKQFVIIGLLRQQTECHEHNGYKKEF